MRDRLIDLEDEITIGEYRDLEKQNEKLKQAMKDTYDTSQEIMAEQEERLKHLESINKILDKYKDIDNLHKDVICLQNSEKRDLLKFKNAWEELKDWFNAPIMRNTVVYGRLEWTDINYKIQEIEQKHNISKEME